MFGLRHSVALLGFLLVSACATISDGTRAIAYGWVDASEVSGAKLNKVLIFDYGAFARDGMGTAEGMSVAEFDGGYIFWHFDVGMGQYAISNFQTQTCLVVCGPINEFSVSATRNDWTRINVTGPAAYYMGSYKLSGQVGGILTGGTFDFSQARNGPSRQELLAFLRTKAPAGSVTAEILGNAR